MHHSWYTYRSLNLEKGCIHLVHNSMFVYIAVTVVNSGKQLMGSISSMYNQAEQVFSNRRFTIDLDNNISITVRNVRKRTVQNVQLSLVLEYKAVL